MKTAAILAFVAATLVPSTPWAHSIYLFGRIGKSPVMAALDRKGDALTGRYLYLDVGKPPHAGPAIEWMTAAALARLEPTRPKPIEPSPNPRPYRGAASFSSRTSPAR
jgi:hypothetical protein